MILVIGVLIGVVDVVNMNVMIIGDVIEVIGVMEGVLIVVDI